MAGKKRQPGPYCQEERPLWIDTGTLCVTELPAPAPQLDPFTSTGVPPGTHSVRYTEPEDVSFELADAPRMCVETSLTEISLAQMRVLAWLRGHRSEILAAELKYRVDRRAIAGAIAWEALMNVRRKGLRALGPGKGHLWDFSPRLIPTPFPGVVALDLTATTTDTLLKQVEDADWLPSDERLPKRTYAERESLQKTADGAITYMAAAMNAASHLTRRAGFPSIRKRPEILSYFWQKKDLRTWQRHLDSKPQGADFATGPDPTVDMDRWVLMNLRYLEDAVGTPEFNDD